MLMGAYGMSIFSTGRWRLAGHGLSSLGAIKQIGHVNTAVKACALGQG